MQDPVEKALKSLLKNKTKSGTADYTFPADLDSYMKQEDQPAVLPDKLARGQRLLSPKGLVFQVFPSSKTDEFGGLLYRIKYPRRKDSRGWTMPGGMSAPEFSRDDLQQMGVKVVEAKSAKKLFIFKWKASDQEIIRILAHSLRQAILLAGKKVRSPRWFDSSLEDGTIDYDIVATPSELQTGVDGPTCPNCGSPHIIPDRDDVENWKCSKCGWSWPKDDVTDSIKELIRTAPYDSASKKMLKNWDKGLRHMLPVSNAIKEAIDELVAASARSSDSSYLLGSE